MAPRKIRPAPESIEGAQPIAPAPTPVLNITFDLYQMSVADLPLVHRMRRGEVSDDEVIALFDRVVIGGSSSIPLPALRDACTAFYRAVFSAGEPETSAGN